MRRNSYVNGRSHLKVSVMHHGTVLILSGSLFSIYADTDKSCSQEDHYPEKSSFVHKLYIERN